MESLLLENIGVLEKNELNISCIVCATNIKSKKDNVVKHLASRSHQEKKSGYSSHLNFLLQDKPGLQVKDNKIYCISCNTYILQKKYHIDHHLASDKHRNVSKQNQFEFNKDLTAFLVHSNIPWNQLQNPKFQDFMINCINGKYSKETILPSESNLRNNYLNKIYEEKKKYIREELKDSFIYLMVDETQDGMGKHVANVLIGKLSQSEESKSHLLASKVLDATNHASIVNLVVDTLKDLWGTNYQKNKDNFLCFVTDAGSYMLKAGKILGQMFSNLTHVTCLAHGLNRVAEKVRNLYPKINTLIDNVKKIFNKAPKRIAKFKETLPNMPLPPKPVLTRWGTWLDAVAYYDTNFDQIKEIINTFNSNEAVSIRKAQKVFRDPIIRKDLEFVNINIGNIIRSSINKLQNPKLTVSEALNIVNGTEKKLSRSRLHLKGKQVYHKLKTVLKNNPGYTTVTAVNNLLRGQETELTTNINKNTLQNYTYLNYVPLTSVDVERSFSSLKWIYTSRRRSLTAINLERIMIIYFEDR